MLIETIHYKGHAIEVHTDEDPINPRIDYDPFGTMLCWHRRYNLGDADALEGYSADDFESWDAVAEHLEKKEGAVIVLPLSLYDHSGITMFVGEASGWDSGQVGFIYATRKQILDNFGGKRLTKKLLARAREVLEAEVSVYDQYLRGDVYGYVIHGATECDEDSCWGFFGRDYMIEEVKKIIDHCMGE